MVLVRIAYVADMPTPDEAIRMIEQNGGASPVVSGKRCAAQRAGRADRPRCRRQPARMSGAARRQRRAVGAAADDRAVRPRRKRAPARRIASFPELVALAGEKRDLLTKAALEADVRLVRIEDGRLEVALERSAARTLINDLSRKLEQWTGRRWTVIVSNEAGQPTLRAQNAGREEPARARRRGRSAGAGSAGAISRRQGRRSAQACRRAAGIRC